MDIALIITIAGFVMTVIAGAIKYGADRQQLLSKNEMQDMTLNVLEKNCQAQKDAIGNRLDSIEKSMITYQEHNLKQHEEFYAVKDVTIELKSDMKYIKDSLEDIKGLLSDRRTKA